MLFGRIVGPVSDFFWQDNLMLLSKTEALTPSVGTVRKSRLSLSVDFTYSKHNVCYLLNEWKMHRLSWHWQPFGWQYKTSLFFPMLYIEGCSRLAVVKCTGGQAGGALAGGHSPGLRPEEITLAEGGPAQAQKLISLLCVMLWVCSLSLSSCHFHFCIRFFHVLVTVEAGWALQWNEQCRVRLMWQCKLRYCFRCLLGRDCWKCGGQKRSCRIFHLLAHDTCNQNFDFYECLSSIKTKTKSHWEKAPTTTPPICH